MEEAAKHDDIKRIVVPSTMKQLRSCLLCGLVKTLKQFEDEGCENCMF